MTLERQTELSLLLGLSGSINPENIDADKYFGRLNELLEEFLSPYVKDTAEKSE